MEEIKKKNNKIRKYMKLISIALSSCFIIFGICKLRCEYLEYKEIGENFINVFWTNTLYTLATGAINFVLVFLILYITTKIIHKGLKPFFEDEKKEIIKLPNKSIVFIIALISSLIINFFVQDKVLMFFNKAWFGISDPIYNNDIGYYFFVRPFYILLTDYLSVLIIGTLAYTVIYYLLAFNMIFNALDRELLKKSVLIKQTKAFILIFAVIQAVKYYLKSQDILYGSFTSLQQKLAGAGLTDVTISSWGYRILPIVIIISVFLAVYYVSKNKPKKGVISLAVLPSYLILVCVVGWIFEITVTSANELDSEKKYIEYNISYTSMGYDLDVEEYNIDLSQEITTETVEDNKDIINNINILSEETVLSYVNEYCTEKGYYQFTNCNLVQYNDKSIYLCVREINTTNNKSYLNRRYEYTHGYGFVAIDANEVSEKGLCKVIEEIDLQIKEPRIYYGENTNEHVIVNANGIDEIDYEQKEYSYDGNGGLSLNYIDKILMGIKLRRFSNDIFFKSNFRKQGSY